MLAVEAHHIGHRYEDAEILKNINLQVKAGESFALVGHNGAGKSTLLRLLALLEEPRSGKIIIRQNGEILTRGIAARRRLVLVLQRPFLFDTTVWDNVCYGLKLRRLPTEVIQESAETALEIAGLRDLARRSATRLSGGESQLLNLARAFALQPDVLLLDEVTAHLDPANEARAESSIRRFSQETHATIIMVTQNLPQACRIAARGAILYQGEVLESGALPGLLMHPKNSKVAHFVQGQVLS